MVPDSMALLGSRPHQKPGVLAGLLYPAVCILWLLETGLAAPTGSSEGDCFNPLFQPHWAGKSDIRHLASKPTIQNSLNLCPFWNLKPACCTASFEDEQQQAFQLWESHWKRKEAHLESFRSQMEDFRTTQEYRDASSMQRALFDAARQSVRVVVATYGVCFDTLLEYVAGMLCFSCQPHWHHQVLLSEDHARVLLLRIAENSNNELWDHCSSLSSAAQELDHRIEDSMLAKSMTSSYVDFRMFDDRIRLSQYMESVGRVIMRGPSENVIKKTQAVGQNMSNEALSRQLSPAPARNRMMQNQSKALTQTDLRDLISPMEDGRRSGFVFRVFPRNPLPGKGTRGQLSLAAACLLVLLLQSA